MRLIITDVCTEDYLAILGHVGPGKAFPKAMHGLCYFHLIIFGFNKHIKPLLHGKLN